MVREVYLLIALLVIAGAVFLRRARIGFQQLRKYWGKMLVTCPENQETSAVEVAKARAAIYAAIGRSNLELCSCTRWPEKEDCGQECLSQLASDPESHRLWTIANQWFAGKKCVYCGRLIGNVSRLDHYAALRNLDQITVEWDQVPAEKLPEALKVSDAVCWGCHVAETFRREHPDLVVERPWKH